MKENEQAFYHSKGKLFLGVIFSLVFAIFGAFVLWIAYLERSAFVSVLGLFITLLLSTFAVANTLKIIRGYPYVIITDKFIQLEPFTKSETTIYVEDISYLRLSEASFQRIIEIVLHEEDLYFQQLSFHNKVRLFMNRLTGFSTFMVSLKMVRKQERPALFEALEQIQQQVDGYAPVNPAYKLEDEVDFIEKYNPIPPNKLSIDRAYFLKAYGYSLLFFVSLFIFFYWLMSKNNDYLFYISLSFVAFPFAKVLIDWLFRFKFVQRLDHQKGVTYQFDRLLFLFDVLLFHISLFIAPFGLLFLLIRFIVNRLRR